MKKRNRMSGIMHATHSRAIFCPTLIHCTENAISYPRCKYHLNPNKKATPLLKPTPAAITSYQTSESYSYNVLFVLTLSSTSYAPHSISFHPLCLFHHQSTTCKEEPATKQHGTIWTRNSVQDHGHHVLWSNLENLISKPLQAWLILDWNRMQARKWQSPSCH